MSISHRDVATFTRRSFSYALIAIYLAVPWISINGQPLLRFDFIERKLTLFGIGFLPTDVPIFALVLLGVVGTLLLVAQCGRVFCGWLCLHNVFLEMLFRPIEQWLEGPAHRRRRQDAKPNAAVYGRKAMKWLFFILVSGALANAGTALFVGTEAFIGGVLINPATNPGGSVLFMMLFAAVLFNFSWFREQTCTIVCPYGRIQGAMLDDQSLIVAYDHHRGEPRGKRSDPNAADCVDCERCIQVCPTGIDIRNGTQLECIHCTACIDACNTVMSKMERAPGLIRYTSEKELAGGTRQWLRPRIALYGVAILVLASLLTNTIMHRQAYTIRSLPTALSAQAFTADDGQAWQRVQVRFSIRNLQGHARDLSLQLDPPSGVIRSGGRILA